MSEEKNRLRIEMLEDVIKRHKLGIKGEHYFSNKQIAIERNEKAIEKLEGFQQYYETFTLPRLEELGGEKSVLRSKTRDLVEKPSNDTDSKPPSCFMGDCKDLECEDIEAQQGTWGRCHEFKPSAQQTGRGRWEGKEWYNGKLREYQIANATGKKEVAEPSCYCCGSPIEDRACFCKPCFIETQRTPEGYKLVEKEDLEWLLRKLKKYLHPRSKFKQKYRRIRDELEKKYLEERLSDATDKEYLEDKS